MKPNLALRAACCALIGLAGCTNLPKAKDYSTALGEPQSQLQQDPNWSGGRIWVRPGPPIGSQFDKKLLMEEVTFIPGDRPDELDFRDGAEMRQRVLTYMNAALRREFTQAGYQLISAPAPRSVRLLLEASARDATTNQLLIASLGAITGSNLPENRKSTAADVQSAIDDWARRVREQFERIWVAEIPKTK